MKVAVLGIPWSVMKYMIYFMKDYGNPSFFC